MVAATQDMPREAALMDWADRAGVEAPALEPASFGALRGVRATARIGAGEPLVTVPHGRALEVLSAGAARGAPAELAKAWNIGDAYWKAAPWWARLALLLLFEAKTTAATTAATAASDGGSGEDLTPWLRSLPGADTVLLGGGADGAATALETPYDWDDDTLDAWAQYEPLSVNVRRQQRAWRDAYTALTQQEQQPSPPPVSRVEFEWALRLARSRAFSGPHEGSSAPERVAQVGFALLLGGVYAALGAGPLENALSGVACVALATVLRDFLFTRSGVLKRYTLCPVVDLANHRGAVSSELRYDYFYDRFVLTSDAAREPGEQVWISYGPRSNDELLQWYGFVEADNPHEEVVMPSFFPDVATHLGADAATAAKLTGRGVEATRGGFAQEDVDAVRRLVATSGGGGGAAGGAAAEEATTAAALRAACDAALARFATTVEHDEALLSRLEAGDSDAAADPPAAGDGGGAAAFASDLAALRDTTASGAARDARRLALQFRLEKKRLIRDLAARCEPALVAAGGGGGARIPVDGATGKPDDE